MSEQSEFRAGYVAIVGEPNVGKSTLLNAILDQKLSIVTRKPQTTRQRVLGIYSTDRAQIIFVDTPGLIRPAYRLQEEMVRHAEHALADADIVVAMTDVEKGGLIPEEILNRLSAVKDTKPLILLLNKADAVYKPHILPIMDRFITTGIFRDVIPLSALKRVNLSEFMKTVLALLPVHEPYYPTDEISEQPERFFVAEFIREKIFESYLQEIPYSTAVQISEFKERERGKTYVSADIVVERESQKGIVIGAKGEGLKKVGAAARRQIEAFLGRSVFLELNVKVRAHWRDDEQAIRHFGYHAD